jgi:hypothetical protein
MSKNIEKTQPGWQIPSTVKEHFDTFCVHVGHVAQEDCAGALILWPRMPAQIREWAKLEAKNDPQVEPVFWARLEKLIVGAIPMLLETGESQKQTGTKSSKSA